MIFPTSWLESPIHRVEVWSKHLAEPIFVGRLNYEVAARTCSFTWSDEAHRNNLVLSPLTLPLSLLPWSSGGATDLPREYHGLPGLLNDSLPDGWGLPLIAQALVRLGVRPELITPAARLAYLGDRAWGSLSFQPVLEDTSVEEMSIDTLGRGMASILAGRTDEVSNAMLQAGNPPQGARPKVLMDLSGDFRCVRASSGPTPEGFRSWLIKFAAHDEPEDAPILEQAYMVCARAAGLTVTDSRLLDISAKPAFAAERFDRTSSGQVFCHSLGGLIHFSHRAIGLDYVTIAQVLDRLAVHQSVHQEAYRRAVFNAVMSVRDDHAKNFAFTIDRSQKWNLSPAYDLTYMNGPGGYHSLTFAGGTARDPARADLMRVGEAHHVAPQDAARVIDEILNIADQVGSTALGLGARRATVTPIVRRLKEIAKPLQSSAIASVRPRI